MRKLFVAITALLLTFSAQGQAEDFETAAEAVMHMGPGWNLGNTLDANGAGVSDVVKSETYWGQPVTRPELMKMFKEAGFGAIRVPVTWYAHINADGNVDAAWMKRVHEVVDYVIDAGLYCVINVHHDTGAHDQAWVIADEANYNKTKVRYEHLWTQIANEFKDYDQHLLFAGYNEMLDRLQSWCFASFNTQNSGRYDATVATSAYKGLNGYAQSFVNAVRATGGNNAQRNLVINTYASANGVGSWNSHLIDVLTNLEAPTDVVEGHLAYEVHAYPGLSTGKSEVSEIIKKVKQYLGPKGPVIIGEWGTSNVDAAVSDYDAHRKEYLDFAKYFIEQTKSNNIATFYWMGLSDGTYRSTPAFNQPDLAETIAKAWHGDDFKGVYPKVTAEAGMTAWEGDKLLNWGDGFSIDKALFAAMPADFRLELTYKQESDNRDADIQFFYGNWSEKPAFTVDGVNYSGDFNPAQVYGTGAGTEHTTAFTFSEAVYQLLAQRGLIVHGVDVRVSKAVLATGSSSGVVPVGMMQPDTDSPVYNLQGVRQQGGLSALPRGVYIQGGRKIVK